MPDAGDAGAALDGLHGARAVEARAAGAHAALRGVVRRHDRARRCRQRPPIELIHAASLILDDLPSMDDAPLRRGRATNHKVFGEAIAILAAFALLNLPSARVATAYEPELAARMTSLLSGSVGLDGLVGGQAADLLATDQAIDFEMLERIHRGKTGALFVAAAASRRADAPAPPPTRSRR